MREEGSRELPPATEASDVERAAKEQTFLDEGSGN